MGNAVGDHAGLTPSPAWSGRPWGAPLAPLRSRALSTGARPRSGRTSPARLAPRPAAALSFWPIADQQPTSLVGRESANCIGRHRRASWGAAGAMEQSRYPLVRRWTPEDHQRLIAMAAAGNRPDDIARALGHGQNRLCEVARISTTSPCDWRRKSRSEPELRRPH